MTGRPAAQLYLGRVMHMRLQPRSHQFRYRVFSLLLDLDHIDDTVSKLKLMRRNAFGLFGFYDKDHGARDGSDLRMWVEAQLSQEEQPRPHRIELLAFPRLFGFVFNPISVYFCFDREERLSCVVYEVKNTFGDQVAYVLPCADGVGTHHHHHEKQMYVSPFIELEQTYRFVVRAPDESLSLRIKQSGQGGDTLIATHNAEAAPLTDKTLLRVLFTYPLMTAKVVLGIHYEALRLFLKGVKFNRYSKSQIFSRREDWG